METLSPNTSTLLVDREDIERDELNFASNSNSFEIIYIYIYIYFAYIYIHIYACMLSHFSSVQLFAMLWTVAHQAPLSMGLSQQEYWSGLPFPPPGNLPNPGIEPESLTSLALAVSANI